MAMGDKLIESVTTVAVAIVGIAIIAVLVSGQAQTSRVIGAAGSAFAQDIGAAVSPVTGGGGGFTGGGGANLPLNL
jgi:hypothetical protein